MKNERKQTNRNVEQGRNTRGKHSGNNKGAAKLKRPLSWDARDLKTSTWVRESTGRYENRFFEQDEN